MIEDAVVVDTLSRIKEVLATFPIRVFRVPSCSAVTRAYHLERCYVPQLSPCLTFLIRQSLVSRQARKESYIYTQADPKNSYSCSYTGILPARFLKLRDFATTFIRLSLLLVTPGKSLDKAVGV